MSQAALHDPATPAQGTIRGLMAALWRGSLQSYCSNDPAFGTRLTEDFVAVDVAHSDADGGGEQMGAEPWYGHEAAVNGAPSVGLRSTSSPDGVVEFIAGVETALAADHEGADWQYGKTATSRNFVNLPSHGTAPRGRVVFQVRADLSNAEVAFLGLREAGIDFLSATSTLPAASDYAGFYKVLGVYTFNLHNDNNGGTAVSDSITIPSSIIQTGYNNFGFAFNVDGSIEVVVNGQWLGALSRTLNRLARPIETLGLGLSATRGTVGDATTIVIPVDRIDVYVENNY